MSALPPFNTLHGLYSDHHRWLQAWLMRRLGNEFDAADIAQDTFVKLLKRGDAQPQVDQPRVYLATVAKGLVVSHIRRQSLEQAYLEALAALPKPLAPSCDERLQAMQALAEIDRWLHKQPEQLRKVFQLLHFEGLSYPEIAQRLGVTVDVVQKSVIRIKLLCYRAIYG